MAGPVSILAPDRGVAEERKWQLLKSPSIVQTAVTAAQLMQNLHDISFTESTVQFLDVERYKKIRIQLLADGSNNHTPVLDLYGWHASGPGHHMAKITTALGNFTSAATTGFHAKNDTHVSIRNAFAPATAYRGADTYTITADYERFNGYTNTDDNTAAGAYFDTFRSVYSPSTTAGAGLAEADFPSYVDVDFSRSHYKFFGVLVTNLGSATTVGAIWTPICTWY